MIFECKSVSCFYILLFLFFMSQEPPFMHDKLFKLSMQNHSIAKDFFRGHLPESIQSRCNWPTLKLCKETFVNKDYHAHAADVLYSVNIDGRQSYLYLLSEHQSKPDRLMPLRLWGYLCQIWQLSAKDKKQKKLPLIYPLVFYHGKRSPYPYSMDFLRLFEEDRKSTRLNSSHT